VTGRVLKDSGLEYSHRDRGTYHHISTSGKIIPIYYRINIYY